MRKKLGVNIDHIATLREARKAGFPDPVEAAVFAELAGADGITVHLREDRRHIQDRDVYLLRSTVKTLINLEMALNPSILEIALKVLPDEVCIVPENREEVTTEGGLDVIASREKLREFVPALQAKNIIVSIFIDPDPRQIEAAVDCGAEFIEIHTGSYADAKGETAMHAEFEKVRNAAGFAQSIGLRVNAGHGLNYRNVAPVCGIPQIETLNIGHSIVSRAVYTGLERAVRDMIEAMR
jgi:pyridoxine 5-phosphate synthase